MDTASRIWCRLLVGGLLSAQLAACFSTGDEPEWLPQYMSTAPDSLQDTGDDPPEVTPDAVDDPPEVTPDAIDDPPETTPDTVDDPPETTPDTVDDPPETTPDTADDATGPTTSLIAQIQSLSTVCSDPDSTIGGAPYAGVQGVVTTVPLVLSDGATRMVLSDETDGVNSALTIDIADDGGEAVAGDWYLGARVTFDGKLQETRCHTELRVTTSQAAASLIEPGNTMAPVALTVAELTADLEGWESVLVTLIPPDGEHLATVTALDDDVLQTDLCESCDPPIGVDRWLAPDLTLEPWPIEALTGVVHQVGDQFRISPRYASEITSVPPCDPDDCNDTCVCPSGQVCHEASCIWPACTCFGSGCEDTCSDGLRCLYMLESPWSDYDANCESAVTSGTPCVVWSYGVGGNGHAYEVYGNSQITGVDETTGWSDASIQAAAAGGSLITLTSQAEIDYLQDYLTPHLTVLDWYGHGPFLGAQQDFLPGGGAPDAGWSWTTNEGWNPTLAANYWTNGGPYYDGGTADAFHCLTFVGNSFNSWRTWPCGVSSAWTVERLSAVGNKPALEAASSLACMPSSGEKTEGKTCATSEACAAPLQCLHGQCMTVCQIDASCDACPNGFASVDASVGLGLCIPAGGG